MAPKQTAAEVYAGPGVDETGQFARGGAAWSARGRKYCGLPLKEVPVGHGKLTVADFVTDGAFARDTGYKPALLRSTDSVDFAKKV